MAYPEVLIPPSVQPESPVEIEPIDDQTVVFSPQFARGLSQRQTWGDPLWGMRLRYKGLSQADRALLKSAISASRGKGANLRVTPGLPLRGSFPATELLVNNNFASGTTGWTATNCTLSASDRVLRMTNTKGGGAAGFTASQTSLSVTQYAPYAVRGMITALSRAGMSNGPYLDGGSYATDRAGLVSKAAVQLSATTAAVHPGYFDTTGLISSAGDYADLSWTSLARCFLVDSGPNALLYSDQIDNAAWTKTRCTATANQHTAPDGTTTADKITEDASTNTHFFAQSYVRASAAEDWVAWGYFGRSVGTRNVLVQIASDTTPTNYAYAYFNLGTGAVMSSGVAGTATNVRAYSVAVGGGEYLCVVVGRLAATTTAYAKYAIANASPAESYAGDGASALIAWRCGAAASSVPVLPAQTTTTATTGTTQTSNRLYVKGLPASTSGLLLAGDFVEINGELERVIAPLDSNAAGLGVLILGRRRAVAPADNDPIIVLNPMGRFMVQAVRETERYGLYTDVELDLIEAPA